MLSGAAAVAVVTGVASRAPAVNAATNSAVILFKCCDLVPGVSDAPKKSAVTNQSMAVARTPRSLLKRRGPP
jgi:hypothetical protein